MMPLKALYSLYFGVFESALVFLRKFGILGELVFTIYGLLWLLWPLYVAYKLENKALYVPAVVATIFFIVLG